MNTINKIWDAAGAQRWVFPKRMLPIAAGLALALASAAVNAQTSPGVGCSSQKAGDSGSEATGDRGPSQQAQKAGDGGSEATGDRGPSQQAQKVGDGGSETTGDRGPSQQAQKAESESTGDHGPSWQTQRAGFTVPCKK